MRPPCGHFAQEDPRERGPSTHVVSPGTGSGLEPLEHESDSLAEVPNECFQHGVVESLLPAK